MKTKIFPAAVVGLMLIAGCLPSLNPIFTDADLVFDPDLLGEWKQQGSKATWVFSKAGDQDYHLIFTDNEGRSGRFQAHLAQVGDLRLLDLFPEKEDIAANAFYQFHLVPIHTVYVVERQERIWKFRGMDNRWLDDFLTSNPGAVPNATYNGHKLITASTSELQTFVLEHRDQFTLEFNLERKSE